MSDDFYFGLLSRRQRRFEFCRAVGRGTGGRRKYGAFRNNDVHYYHARNAPDFIKRMTIESSWFIGNKRGI